MTYRVDSRSALFKGSREGDRRYNRTKVPLLRIRAMMSGVCTEPWEMGTVRETTGVLFVVPVRGSVCSVCYSVRHDPYLEVR